MAFQVGQTATNPETGEKLKFNGQIWEPVDVTKPSKGIGQQAFENLVPSTVQLVKDVVTPFVHPIETGSNIIDLGSSILGKLGVTDADPSKANAVGQYLADRYGGVENLKQTFAKDPAGILADASMILTGGGTAAAKLPGVLGKTASTAAKVGRAIDPLTAIPKVAGKATSVGLGFTTGAGGRSLEEAAKAGYAGGKPATKYQEQLRGTAPVSDVVKEAKVGLDQLRQQRSNLYKSGMVNVKNDKTILSFADIDKAVSDVKNRGYFKGQEISGKAAPAWDDISNAINEWKQLDPVEFHTPEGIDALKKKIGDIRDSLPYGTPARGAADKVYSAIRDEISHQAPEYSRVMQDYHQGSELLDELQHSLSVGENARADTTVRKLQSILRNNANTNYGRRAELANELVNAGSKNLMPMLAGQALSSATPRGLSGIGVAGGTASLGAAMSNPAVLAGLPLTSPRLMGEAAYYAGKTVGTPARLGQMLSQYGDKLAAQNPKLAFAIDAAQRAVAAGKQVNPQVARMLAIQLARMEQAQQEQ